MKAISISLKGIYKAGQCADLNDVNFAIVSLKTIARDCYNGNYTPSMKRRLNSLEKRKIKMLVQNR